jgi:type I restriction enzyme M protein
MQHLDSLDFASKIKELIDSLKAICASYGLGNDGNEFKIITQVFLYKFTNDKFAYEVKNIDEEIAQAAKWEQVLKNKTEDEYEFILLQLPPNTAQLKPDHLISTLFEKQNDPNFAKLFDDTLRDIAIQNSDIFSVKTEGDTKIPLFDRVSEFITDTSKRDPFCKAIINQLVKFSAEHIFTQKYDFFATLFEYLIKDYNKDNGGKYAEYYTPHAVAKIMAAILVKDQVQNVTVYDPSAGSGTLLMNIAHAIGENNCTIYSQDISQKSSSLLRLNLILNNLVHSIPNIIQGNTLLHPYHQQGARLMKFDYIVSNPPFKMDFSDYQKDLDTKANQERFFAGIPKVPSKATDKMAIYTLFLQHIIYSLNKQGKAAVVVPTGFITAQSGIDKAIRTKLTDFGWRFPIVRQYTNEPNRMAKKGDILLSVRAPVGTLNIADNDCCIGRGLAAIRSKYEFNSYLFYVMKYFKTIFDHLDNSGTTFGSITKDDLFNLKLVYPHGEHLKKYDLMVYKYNQLILNNHIQNQQLTKLRDWLLPMLMNGQITIK